MTKVYLHGAVGRKFGKSHKFKVRSKKEVFNALCGTNKGFKQYIVKNTQKGLFYKLVDVNGVCLNLSDYNKKAPEEIHLVPTIIGSGPLGALFAGLASFGQAVAGAAAAFSSTGFGSMIVESLINMGISILIQGILNLLFGDQGQGQEMTGPLNTQSYLFNNHVNTAVQGFGIPIVYGELRIGSYTISTNMRNVDLSQS